MTTYSERIKKIVVNYCETNDCGKAAQHFGIGKTTICKWIGQETKKKPLSNLDLGLAVIAAVAPAEGWTLSDLSEVCGVRQQEMEKVFKKAIRKAFRAMSIRYPELHESYLTQDQHRQSARRNMTAHRD